MNELQNLFAGIVRYAKNNEHDHIYFGGNKCLLCQMEGNN